MTMLWRVGNEVRATIRRVLAENPSGIVVRDGVEASLGEDQTVLAFLLTRRLPFRAITSESLR